MKVNLGVIVAIVVGLLALGTFFKYHRDKIQQFDIRLENLLNEYNSSKKENEQLKETIQIDSIKMDSLREEIQKIEEELAALENNLLDELVEVDNMSADSSYKYLQLEFPDDSVEASYEFSEDQVKALHREVIKAANQRLSLDTYEELHIYYEQEITLANDQIKKLKKINSNLEAETDRLKKLSGNVIDLYNQLKDTLEREQLIKNIAIALGVTQAVVIAILILI